MSSAIQCCVPGCEETQGMQVLHKFPNPAEERERFNEWLYAVGGNIIDLPNEYIYKNRRVCRGHFEDKYLCRSNKISNIAVPTLNLPGPLACHKYTFGKRRPMRLIQTIDENIVEPSTSRGLTSVQEDLSGIDRPLQHPETVPEVPTISVTDFQNISTTDVKMCKLGDTLPKENIGSEEEEDGDDDYDLPFPVIIPRSMRLVFEGEDEEEESEQVQKQLYDLPMIIVKEEPTDSQKLSLPVVSSSLDNIDDTDLKVCKPIDLFEFEWRPLPDPPIQPELRREKFTNRNPGPVDNYGNPYDAFTAIWDKEIMEQICDQTNLYAQQMTENLLANDKLGPLSRITKWKDMNVDELYVYLAIVLSMGLVIKSRLEEYWSNKEDIFMTPGFSEHMSIDRFLLISRRLHFNNNNCLRNLNLSSDEAKLYKIQPIIDHLNIKFSTLYSLNQNITLDQSLTQWNSVFDMNGFIRHETMVGIKSYEICECHTGYLWRFEVHAGFEPSKESSPVSGAIPTLVLRLIRGLEFKGHTLWMNTTYNSPALARTLKSKQFDCVGTLHTKQLFVPGELAELQEKHMVKGQNVGCTSGDVDLLVWRDKTRVALISTYHGAITTQCGDVSKPAIINDYYSCMREVDRKDQLLNGEDKRTKVWYKKLFRRLLNVSALNSYIMYKYNTPEVSYRDFRLDLVRQLLVRHNHQRPITVSMSTKSNKRPKFSAEHLPSEYGLYSGRKAKIRRTCVMCKELTHTYCPGCNVALCIYIRDCSSSAFSCFRKHHT